MKNGEQVRAFEAAFAEYVGARYAIALCNGTATIHTALVALGVKPEDRVAVPPLTMSATTIAVLQAGAVPVFYDVCPDSWQMKGGPLVHEIIMPVMLYGIHPTQPMEVGPSFATVVQDAAQTLMPYNGAAFTSYSFQASKILPLGEGGMLVTNNEELATKAREFSSLGYRMRADQPRIDPAVLKSPTFERHHTMGWNYRMNDLTAAEGLRLLGPLGGGVRYVDALLAGRRKAAGWYRQTIEASGCDWLTPQHVPEGWSHDYWTYAVACDTPERAVQLSDAVVKHGGERPYPAWRLTYQEPAFRHLAPDGTCPVAESLQPRLLQIQTNNIDSAGTNARALERAIEGLR